MYCWNYWQSILKTVIFDLSTKTNAHEYKWNHYSVWKKGKDHHFVTFTLWLYTSMYMITILVISTVAQWRTFQTIIWRRTRVTTVVSNISFVTCCTLKQIDMSDSEYACKYILNLQSLFELKLTVQVPDYVVNMFLLLLYHIKCQSYQHNKVKLW